MSRIRRFWKQTLAVVNRAAVWSVRHLPPGVRSGLGLLCIAGGVVGFLLDIPPLRRRVLRWLARQQSG